MLTIIIVIVFLYAAFRIGAGHAHARHYRAHGVAPSVYWRAGLRGSWVSVRLPGGFRVGHRL